MTERVGRYPFDIYGSLIVDAELGFALETQTISLYDKIWFTEYGQGAWDPTMVHELAHEWFGNSVSPEDVERPVAERGPRKLVRVPLRRAEGLPRGGHDGLAGRDRLRDARGADARGVCARRRVAR